MLYLLKRGERMKLSISNLAWNSNQNKTVYKLMKKYGFIGVEIAPTKIFPETPYSHIEEASEWAKSLKRTWQFEIPSMQSIWYGRTEKLFGSEEERNVLLNYTKSAIDFASAIKCKNLVFGCPKNRNIPAGDSFAGCNKIAVDFFKKLGDYAASKSTCIGMEANPAIYGTNFINTTEEALSLVKHVGSDGFKLNLDVGTMIQNCEPVSILQGNVRLINHVHISEPFLKKIEHRVFHNELIEFLKAENNTGFTSIEMEMQENICDIEQVMKYLKELHHE